MKTNKHNLDNYFEAARRDELPFSIDEARTTIENTAVAGSTSFFGKLIQGKNKMISIPITAVSALIVGLLSYNMLTQTQEQEMPLPAPIVHEQQNLPANEYLAPEIETAEQETPLLAENKTPVKHERIVVKRTKIHDTNIIPNVDVSGIKLIELDDNKLAELGVTQSEDGDYTQIRLSKHGIMKVFNDLSEEISFKNKDSESYLGITPVMITDITGTGGRRTEVRFKDVDSEDMQYRVLMHTVRNKPINIEKLRQDVKIAVNSPDNDEHFKRVYINRDSLAKNINIDSLISTENIRNMVSNVNVEDILKQINIDSILNSININIDENMMEHLNTDMQVKVIRLNKDGKDSEIRTEVEMEENIKHIKLDTFNFEELNFDELHSEELNFDDLHSEELNFDDLHSLELNFDKFNFQNFKFDFPEINVNEITDMVLFKSREAYHQVNKLVPVSVPIKNAIDSEGNPIPDYAVIAWYEPTEELLKYLPADVAENLRKELNAFNNTDDLCDVEPVAGKESYFDVWRTCSGAVENLSVFPNPTDGNVNIKFDLKTERDYNVSLHNLMGSKVLDLGNYSGGLGEIDINYNLQNVESGLYLIVVQTESGEQAVQRIIKN